MRSTTSGERSGPFRPGDVPADHRPRTKEVAKPPARRPSLRHYVLGIQAAAGNRAALQLLARTGARREARRLVPAGMVRGTPPVMRARLPAHADLQSLLGAGANQAPLTAGLRRLLLDALAELSGPEKSAVHGRARGALSSAELAALPEADRLRRIAEAIRHLHPDRQLGDPAQYGSRLRTGAQRANLATLLSNTDQLFADILAAPDLNTWITEIFGAGQQGRVLRRLRRAKAGLQAAGRRQTITADMSGYSEEVGLGGWAIFQTHISLERGAIQNPSAAGSVQLTLHEAMHFGTGAVVDTVYLENSSDFTTLATDDKVNNAAHYEVLALRVRNPTNALAFPAPNNVFTPQSSAGPAATMTPADEGRRFANRRYRDAWSSSIDLWEEYRRVQQNPRLWARMRRSLPFWSAVEKLTIHNRTIRLRGRADEAPVTLIDLALAENFTRKLNVVWTVLRSQSASALESAHATPAEIAAATTADQHRDLLATCALRASAIHLTGSVDRDAEVVRLLEANAGRLLQPRDPVTAPPP
jgi:hypothetical protein